jgi:hypothetical protein
MGVVVDRAGAQRAAMRAANIIIAGMRERVARRRLAEEEASDYGR